MATKTKVKIKAYRNGGAYNWEYICDVEASSTSIAFRKAVKCFFDQKDNKRRKPSKIILELLTT